MSNHEAASSQETPGPLGFLSRKPYYLVAALVALILLGALFLWLTRRTGPTVEVVSFTPTGEVTHTTNFTVTFSHDLVSDSLVNVQLDAGPLRFEPALPGKFRWIARNKLRFYPEVELAPSTDYLAELDPAVAEAAGYTLTGPRRFAFHSPYLRVNYATLSFTFKPETSQEAELLAEVEFNYEVDPQEAARYLALQYEDGRTIPFEVATATPSNVLTLRAPRVERGPEAQNIRLVVKQGLPCVGGTVPLALDFVEQGQLQGQQELKVVRLVPRRQGPRGGVIQIEFNLPLDPQRVEPYLTIEPAIQTTRIVRHRILEVRGEFQPQTTYQVSLRRGLRAVDGSTLERDFSQAVTFMRERIPPQVGFVGDGYYLTRSGHLNLGLSTINADKVEIEVEKIFPNNLVYLLNQVDLTDSYYGWYKLEALGQRVQRRELVVQSVENDEVVTPVNVRAYLDNQPRGIYKFTARLVDERWRYAQRWVVATDLGIVTKKAGDALWVWVQSLSTLEPKAGVAIALISQNNQTLASAVTDADGLAVIEDYRQAVEGFTPYVLTASLGDDLSFVELRSRRIPTSGFDVGGAAYLEHGYEAFVYDERGIYRPGETAHVAAVVRAEQTAVPTPFPVLLKVTGPDGRILSEQRATLNEEGAAEFEIEIPEYARTGRYTAGLYLGEEQELGRTTFNVEEFVPDRMKVKLSTDRDAYTAGETMNIEVEAVTLFGPPAAGRRAQTHLEIEPYVFSPPGWASFTFSDPKKSFRKIRHDFSEKKLDEQGKTAYRYQIATDLQPPSALRAVIATTVLEPGGRGVSDYRAVVIHPYRTYVGVRKEQEGYAEPGRETAFRFAVLDPHGASVAGREVEITLYRIYWHSVLKRVDPRRGYRYVSEEVEEVEQQFRLKSGSDARRFGVVPKEYGRYRLAVRDVTTGASASLSFYASGWGYAPWALDHPDRIELDLDKPAYDVGEQAQIQVRAPFTGKLLLTVEREKIFHHQVIDLTQNTATIPLPVLDHYKPNVYVSAHLIRSTESLERDTPVRAFGVVPLFVNTANHRLTVEVRAPDEVRPKTPLEIELRVRGQKDRTPYLTVAVVDEGICQLTDFRTPDPHGYFFGKKRLSVESYDLYGVILPEIESTLSSASGDVEAARKRRLTPVSVTRVKPVAFWSGLMQTDRNGRARVRFDMPQFTGQVRVMAAVFAGDRFGNARKNVFVREPIVLTPTFPRFIASGDSLVVPVSLYNGTGQDATFEVRLEVEGPAQVTGPAVQSLATPKATERQVYFAVRADRTVGKLTFRLSARGGGERTQMTTDLPLRPPVPFVTLTGSGSLTQASPTAFRFPADWLPGTAEFRLTVSPFPAAQFAGGLQFLLRYPYGCVEQTVSRLFPLLYFDDLARAAEPELFERNSADYFLAEGIEKLESLQLPSGAFAYWPSGDYVNNWSSVYASHFLVEARRAGYEVSDRVYRRLIRALQSTTRAYRPNDRYSYETAVYACYVLALAGKPERSTMLYLRDRALDRLPPFSRFQLAGAFAHAGDRQTARALLPKSAVPVKTTGPRESGRNFNSPVRAQAIMLDILAEVDDRHPLVPVLVKNLSAAAGKRGRWHTTQENAFAFLALGKILRKQQPGNYTGVVTVAGQRFATFETEERVFRAREWAGQEVRLSLEGPGTCYFYWRADGIPSKMHVDEYDRDLLVRRRYLDSEGQPILPSNFRQGQMVVAEITVKALTEHLDNVAVVDLLPAGFEVENPRLQSRRGVPWIGKNAFTPAYLDIRDDRVIFYGNLRAGQTRKFYYGLRAVTRGVFTLPPVSAEAMYAPEKASVASSGVVEIRGL